MSLTKPLNFLRIMAGIFMAVHGFARILAGNVGKLEAILADFPVTPLLAWMVTIVEIIAAILLIINYKVKYACGYLIFQLLMGIYLVHWSEGWFVVGPGRNGMEYNMFLICCFGAFFWYDKVSENPC